MIKRIRIIVFTIAILGISAELSALLNFEISDSKYIVHTIRGLASSLDLTFFNLASYKYYNQETWLYLNFINTIFYFLLLVGAIVYTTSKGRETRLVRFVLSIVFLSNVLFLIGNFLNPFFSPEESTDQSYWRMYWILGAFKSAVFIYVSYYVLTSLHKAKKLGNALDESEWGSTFIANEASSWQRFGHYLLDLYLCISIFSGSAFLMESSSFLYSVAAYAGDGSGIYVFYIIVSLIYFPFFEMIFGATPAKFLTETRVVDENNQKPGFKTILVRTLSRHIPFEQFSFLGAQGLHDRISKTQVVREERTGVKGRWYWLIVPGSLVLTLAIYFGNEEYRKYQSYLSLKNSHEENISAIEKSLLNLTTSDVIKIEDVAHSFSSDDIFLKVEEITPEDIVATIIPYKGYSYALLPVEKHYLANRDSLSTIRIKRSDLERAYTPEYGEPRNSAELLQDGRMFGITLIERFFEPIIHNSGSGSFSGGSIGIKLHSYGWPAHIIAIESLEGDIKWSDNLPMRIPTEQLHHDPAFTISGEGYEFGNKYKFKMVLLDSLDRTYTYIIEGRKWDKTIQKL